MQACNLNARIRRVMLSQCDVKPSYAVDSRGQPGVVRAKSADQPARPYPSETVPQGLPSRVVQHAHYEPKPVRMSSVSFQPRRDGPRTRAVLGKSGRSKGLGSFAWRASRRTVSMLPSASDVPEVSSLPTEWLQVKMWDAQEPHLQPEWAARPSGRPRRLEYVTYNGADPLPQLPWRLPWTGPILLISLFDGVGAVLVALLAMGAVFAAITVELQEDLAAAVRASFANVWQQSDATAFDLGMVREILTAGGYTAILIVGGSPCQDVSMLNRRRAGISSARTQLFQCVPQVTAACEGMLRDMGLSMPVFSLLENVAHTPQAFQRAVAQQMHGPSPFMQDPLAGVDVLGAFGDLLQKDPSRTLGALRYPKV